MSKCRLVEFVLLNGRKLSIDVNRIISIEEHQAGEYMNDEGYIATKYELDQRIDKLKAYEPVFTEPTAEPPPTAKKDTSLESLLKRYVDTRMGVNDPNHYFNNTFEDRMKKQNESYPTQSDYNRRYREYLLAKEDWTDQMNTLKKDISRYHKIDKPFIEVVYSDIRHQHTVYVDMSYDEVANIIKNAE